MRLNSLIDDEIPSIGTITSDSIMKHMTDKIQKYPAGSLSPRVVMASIPATELEKAQELMNELNAHMSKALEDFISSLKK